MDAHGGLIPIGRLGESIVVHVFQLPHIGELGKIIEQPRCLFSNAAGTVPGTFGTKVSCDPVRHIGVHVPAQRLFPPAGKRSEAGRAFLSGLPGIAQEKFDLLLQRLHGTNVHHPQLPDLLPPCLFQLVGGMRQRNGAEEHVGHAGRRPVGIMVIKAVPAAALFLRLRRITADIAVVVIGPHQRHVLRHLQPGIVQIQDLLIGNEGHHGLLSQNVLQDPSLVMDDRFQQLHLGRLPLLLRKLLDGLRLKAGIVDAAHAERIADLEIPVLLHALPPVFLQDLPVPSGDGIIVHRVGIALFRDPGFPLPVIGAHQHVAVGGSGHDPHPVRQRPVFPFHVKGIDVHGRPDIIGLQPKQQLEYLFVGLHPDGILAHVLFHPAVQLLLIVDENAAVLHGGPVRLLKILRQEKFLLLPHRHVRPEIPGRNAKHAAQLIDAVDGPSPVRSRNDKPPLPHIHQVAFFAKLSVLPIQTAGGDPLRLRQRVKVRGHSQRSRQNGGNVPASRSIRSAAFRFGGRISPFFRLIRPAEHLFQIRTQTARRDLHRVRLSFLHQDRTGQSPFQIKIHGFLRFPPLRGSDRSGIRVPRPSFPFSFYFKRQSGSFLLFSWQKHYVS